MLGRNAGTYDLRDGRVLLVHSVSVDHTLGQKQQLCW